MPRRKRTRVGITTTVPLEPILAASAIPVDLNNIFIRDACAREMVESAQERGFPRNICTWIKGLHTASDQVDSVIGVVRGDCSNTESLLDALRGQGKKVHGFSYPLDRDRSLLEDEITSLCDFLGCSLEEASEREHEVEGLRALARRVDEIRWRELRVSASESHAAQVSTSDFDSDPVSWESRTRKLIQEARSREPEQEGVRIGYIGVPPIITDLFERIETAGGSTVFFEVERQFTMPGRGKDWMGRYLSYTYPYDIDSRIIDIKREVKRRRIAGLVHYVQSFCHRQIDDMVFRDRLDMPILTIEGNLPGPADERTIIRLESFIDMLEETA